MAAPLALLLLPRTPQSARLSNLSAALQPTFIAASSRLHALGGEQPAVLEVALPVTQILGLCKTHHDFFSSMNALLANIYRLLASIYEQKAIPIAGTGAVDTRVLLVREADIDSHSTFGYPTVRLSTLATSGRPWTHLFTVDSEQGHSILGRFKNIILHSLGGLPHFVQSAQHLPGGLLILRPSQLGGLRLIPLLPDGIPGRVVAANIIACTFDFTTKYILSMGLVSMPSLPVDQSGSHVLLSPRLPRCRLG